ncbi:hypothetical protein DFH07DRAFT_827503 [Mycena maculata]|uniref:Uncharacterized protein n=1 Tax=Mycena maculata TaxID=230809 RepID=A0AAD7N8N4_9AGAR|nr:hypothetical protein DFH07DRAFT_827503 [Mycena maculata]
MIVQVQPKVRLNIRQTGENRLVNVAYRRLRRTGHRPSCRYLACICFRRLSSEGVGSTPKSHVPAVSVVEQSAVPKRLVSSSTDRTAIVCRSLCHQSRAAREAVGLLIPPSGSDGWIVQFLGCARLTRKSRPLQKASPTPRPQECSGTGLCHESGSGHVASAQLLPKVFLENTVKGRAARFNSVYQFLHESRRGHWPESCLDARLCGVGLRESNDVEYAEQKTGFAVGHLEVAFQAVFGSVRTHPAALNGIDGDFRTTLAASRKSRGIVESELVWCVHPR